MSIFSQLVPYLTDPLIVVGLVLMLGLLLVRFLLRRGLLNQLPDWLEGEGPRWLLSHAYVLGLLLMLLGAYLQHNELREAEQQHALRMLKGEYQQNLDTLDTLKANIQVAIQTHEQISEALRAGDSQILTLIFPEENTWPDTDLDITASVEATFQDLKVTGMLKNEAQMARFNAAKSQIKAEVNRLTGILQSLRLSETQRYAIEQKVWSTHMDVYQHMDDFELSVYEEALLQMEELRDNYISVLGKSAEFFAVVEDFMARSTFLGNRDVYEILSQERESYQLLSIYAEELTAQSPALTAASQQLKP